MSKLHPIVQDALDLLSPPAGREPDWADVLARAGENGHAPREAARVRLLPPSRPRRRRSRRLLVALAALVGLLIVFLATPAFGLRAKLFSLFENAEPAPTPIVENFDSLDIGAPEGMATGVIAGDARAVIEQSVSGGLEVTLYVAPTKTGGFCTATEFRRADADGPVRGGGAGCRTRQDVDARAFATTVSIPGPISAGGTILQGPILVDGSIGLGRAASLEVEFQDGTREEIPLTWVSSPINAAFFVYAVPERHWAPGSQPTVLIARDAEGEEVARDDESLRFIFTNPR